MLQGRAIFQDRQEGEINKTQQAQNHSPIPGKENLLTSIQAGDRLVIYLVEKVDPFGNPWWAVTKG